MKNIIFRQVEYPEIDNLYDDDGIKEISGKNNALYIIASGNYKPVNGLEYDNILNQAENIVNDFYELEIGGGCYFKSYKEILEYYGIKYSPVNVKRFKALMDHYNGSPENIAEFLTITTGEKWNTYSVTGYCQGDFATGIYCENHYNTESLELYVGAAAGIVSEFCRIEGNETIYGYFVPDSITWNIDELRRFLSECYGDKPENITIQLFDGYTQIANYREV